MFLRNSPYRARTEGNITIRKRHISSMVCTQPMKDYKNHFSFNLG